MTYKAIVINPAGTKAYVANYGSNSVTPITLSTGTAGTAITVGSEPDAIAITPNGATAYVGGPGPFSRIAFHATTVTHAPAFGYNADGERCWAASTTSGTGPCSSAPTGATSYGWNSLGQLCWSGSTANATTGCTSPPPGATTYSYDGQGLRVKATPPSGTATFTWDTVTGGGTPLDIDDGTNAYIYGPTGTAPLEQINLSTGAVNFLVSGSSGVQAVFNSSGSLQEEAEYSTYGEQVLLAGSKVTPFGFQGSYSDASGLDYMVNRYYTPTTDQFLSVDPDLPETGQPYAFTTDDPLNLMDPLGLDGGWDCGARSTAHSTGRQVASRAARRTHTQRAWATRSPVPQRGERRA
jgi:RHS repeat-associated protein